MQIEKTAIDLDELHKASADGSCFICEFLRGNRDFKHHIIHESESAVAFLSRFPTLFGYTLVAPKRHVEQVTGDFSEKEYVDLQRFIYRVGEAIRNVLKPERLYILSLGSQSANAHVHWHIAPLPPGIPLEQQQYHALMHEYGVVTTCESDQLDFIRRVQAELQE